MTQRSSAPLVAALLVAVLFVGPLLTGTTDREAGRPPAPISANAMGPRALPHDVPAPGATSIAVNLTGTGPSFLLPASYFGVNSVVDSALPSNESELLEATSARYLVWPGGGFADRYDPLTGLLHNSLGVAKPAPSNESEFITLCRTVACHAIVQVPGEIDSPGFAASVVRYTEQTLGFHPAYWEIGNEPGIWRHFGYPWSAWTPIQRVAPTPQQYAGLVAAYGSAMRAVDPSLRILGLPGTGLGAHNESTWIAAVAALNGAWLAGVAIHAYPAGVFRGTATLPRFFASLNDPNSLPARLPADRAALDGACARCPSLPILVTELGSAALSGSYDPYVEGFPNAVFMAAEVVQALGQNVSNVDSFGLRFTNPGAWESTSDLPRPTYTLFAQVLSRLAGQVQRLDVSGGVSDLFAVETYRTGPPAISDLLVVNANVSDSVDVATGGLLGWPSGPGESFGWDSSTSEPVPQYWSHGMPAIWKLPPMSLALLEVARPSEVPVTATESGLPAGTAWFLTIGGQTGMSLGRTLTLLLPPGRFVASGEPPEWVRDDGRRVEIVPRNISVVGATSIHVLFATQFPLRVSVLPRDAGVANPLSGWYNLSARVTLDARAAPGYVFEGWQGSGSGAYSGPRVDGSLNLSGNVSEVAIFRALGGPAPGGPAAVPSLFDRLPSPALSVAIAVVLVGTAIGINFRRRSRPPSEQLGPVATNPR